MHYTGGSTAITRGSDAGTRTEVVLGPGEFITSIKGIFYDKMVAQLRFTTNKGMLHPHNPFVTLILYSPRRIQGLFSARMGGTMQMSPGSSRGTLTTKPRKAWLAVWDYCTLVDARGEFWLTK